MSTRTHFRGRNYWKTQLPIDYIDTSLTINNWETVDADLSEGAPTQIWMIRVEQTNNGATAEDIELEVTINGTAYTFSGALNSGAMYYGNFSPNLTGGDFQSTLSTSIFTLLSSQDVDQAIPFKAKSVGLIRVRQTSSVDGTSAQIEVNITWDKLVENG